jgi:ParB-like chromosome segregation protein Spo0J
MKSVNFHKKQIQQYGQTSPMWVAKDGNTLTLLDGAHRLVATYLAGKSKIPAFIVDLS